MNLPVSEESVATTSRFGAIALIVLRVLLALFFIMIGVKNLSGNPQFVEDFRRFGYSDAFRMVVGAAQIALGALLLLPKTAFLAALGLAVIMIGAMWSHLRHDGPATLVSPAVFLVLLCVVLFALRPRMGA